MKSTKWSVKAIVLVALVLVSKEALCDTRVDNQPAITVQICDVLKHPSEYAGKKIVMRVRITATKEGTSLWSPTCSKLGMRLHYDSMTGPGIEELNRELKSHGLSDRPILATLTGIFMLDYYDEIKERVVRVFNVTAATDITQSDKVEHR